MVVKHTILNFRNPFNKFDAIKRTLTVYRRKEKNSFKNDVLDQLFKSNTLQQFFHKNLKHPV